MNIIWHVWRSVVKGPFASAAAAGLVIAAFAASLLVAAFFVAAVQGPAILGALGALGALTLTNLLVISRLSGRLNDLSYSVSLNGWLARSGYSPSEFFVDGAAATPSLQVFIAKVLSFCRPAGILELGSGQSSKILSLYARENPAVSVLTLEHSPEWHRSLAHHLAGASNHEYVLAPIQRCIVAAAGGGRSIDSTWYAGVSERLRARRFEFVLVDGPDSGLPGTAYVPYSRSGVVDYLPAVLSDSFVIVIDDAERAGESMTASLIEHAIRKERDDVVRFEIHGVKTQTVICSANYQFLRSV